MSLKAIHILFVTASTLLMLGFGGWSIRNYMTPGGTKVDCAMGVISLLLAVALVIYGKYFLKKLKNVSYL